MADLKGWKKVLFLIEEKNPEGDPDDFAELICATLAAPDNAVWRREIDEKYMLPEGTLNGWARGLESPIPRVRRGVTEVIRKHCQKALEKR
jgi:hypothetical protein